MGQKGHTLLLRTAWAQRTLADLTCTGAALAYDIPAGGQRMAAERRGDLELLRLYVKAQAIGSMRTKGARLDQYKMTGKRNDNPLQPETMSIIEEYDRKIQERKPARVVHLYRTGRVR